MVATTVRASVATTVPGKAVRWDLLRADQWVHAMAKASVRGLEAMMAAGMARKMVLTTVGASASTTALLSVPASESPLVQGWAYEKAQALVLMSAMASDSRMGQALVQELGEATAVPSDMETLRAEAMAPVSV